MTNGKQTIERSKFMKKILSFLICIILLVPTVAVAYEQPVGTPDMSTWFPWEDPDDSEAYDTPLDASFILDAPAGKHGFIKPDGENMFFEDGTRVRFWGTNIAGQAVWQSTDPEVAKENIEKICDRIARSGYNLVRLHQMDATFSKQNIFGFSSTTRKLDPVELDKVFYWIKCLKERGVYIYLDLNVCRDTNLPEDGIKQGNTFTWYRQCGIFDPYLIALQKEYAQQLLCAMNPYTGLALCEDPAIVMVGVLNENGLIGISQRESGLVTGSLKGSYYQAQLQSKFNTWLIEQYPTREELEKAWAEEGSIGLKKDESQFDGTVKIPADYQKKSVGYSKQRRDDIYKFMYYTSEIMYVDMIDYLKNDLGIKCLITGSNIGRDTDRPFSGHLLMKTSDFHDRHSYKSHPTGYGLAPGSKLTSHLTMTVIGGNELLQYTAWNKPYNFPYVIGEWQQCSPGSYAAEAEPYMAVMSSFQNWNTISFDLLSENLFAEGNGRLGNFFDTYYDPQHCALLNSASVIFHRQDVNEAELEYFVPTDYEGLSDSDWSYLNGYENAWAYGKVGIMMTDLRDNPKARQKENLKKMIEKCRNNEPQSEQIDWNRRSGIMTVDTDYSNVALGLIGKKPIDFDKSQITVNNDFAAVTLISTNNKKLEETESMLLTVMARARNTGMQLSENGIDILSAGRAPVLVEPVSGNIILKTTDNIKVYALTTSGKRKDEVPVTKTRDGYYTFDFDGNIYKTVYYEIVQEKE